MRYEDIICDANNLYRAYLASVKSSKWKESTQKFSLNFLRYIFDIQEKLQNRTLTNGEITEFCLRERGKVRPITSLCVSDRIIRHVLCDDIFIPKVKNKIIYDNGASVKGRGIAFSRKRFEVHLKRYYREFGNDGYILFGDFRKFYDNIIHSIAKQELLKLVDNDEFIEWLLNIIFNGFKIDVSYLSDVDYWNCEKDIFDKLKYRAEIPSKLLTGERFMEKSVNIGDQLSQIIGIYYPYKIDNYVKYVRSQKYYGRYMDDWYIINHSKEELLDIYQNIYKIATEYGIHINENKTHIVKVSSTYKYLQVKYSLTNNGHVIKRINPNRVSCLRRKLKKLAVKVSAGELEYANVENMFKGWMGSFYKILSKQQRTNLISLYEELFKKHIKIENKKMIITDL
ncbi:MAG: hypothetical protein LUD27_06670 [Clostridia bacterium]|nr:hypothetical protein [Clostridia bacterium]